MEATLSSAPDFRDAAVAASRIMLKDHPGDPVAAGVSYCVPAEPETREAFDQLRSASKVALAVGIAGVVVGGLIGFSLKFRGFDVNNPHWGTLAIAGCCSLGGIMILFIPQLRARKLLVSAITRRLGSIPPTAIRVGLEDTATVDRPKVVGDDVGFMLLHPEQRCAQIEGLHCRYLIHADDVDLILMPPTKTRAVQLSYHIGQVPLAITISTDSVKKQVFWQLTGRSGTLYDVMRSVLEREAVIPK